jgi:hypothetical protein
MQTNRITPELVRHAADDLEVQPGGAVRIPWVKRRVSLMAGAGVALAASLLAVTAATLLYQRFSSVQSRVASVAPAPPALETISVPDTVPDAAVPAPAPPGLRPLPSDAVHTILAGTFPADAKADDHVRAITRWLERQGVTGVFHATVDLGADGRWHRILAGTFPDAASAAAAADRLKKSAPELNPRAIAAADAVRSIGASSPSP